MTDLKRAIIIPLLLAFPLSGCGGDEPPSDAAGAPAAAVPIDDYSAGGDQSADLEEMADFELTIGDVRRWNALMHSPEFAGVDMAYDASGDEGGGSIEETVEKISEQPRARALIEGAGFDVRDFVLITFTMMAAAFAQYAIEQGADPDSLADADGLNPDNIRFMQEHREELEAMGIGGE